MYKKRQLTDSFPAKMESGNIVVPAGMFASDDDELRRKREDLKRKLLAVDKIVIGPVAYGCPPTDFTKYKDIEYGLKLLINKMLGFMIVSVGDYFVQFCLWDDNHLTFEAVSNMYQPGIGNKDLEFKQLGFSINRHGACEENYTKCVSLMGESSIGPIITEIKIIFERIYNRPFVDYEITEGH